MRPFRSSAWFRDCSLARHDSPYVISGYLETIGGCLLGHHADQHFRQAPARSHVGQLALKEETPANPTTNIPARVKMMSIVRLSLPYSQWPSGDRGLPGAGCQASIDLC